MPQSFVFQLEGRPTAFTTQTIEFTGFMGAVGSLDEITLEFPADCRRASVQGSGNLSYSLSLSTKAQYTFSFCCCKMVATHTLPIKNFRGRGRLWESVSFAVLCPQNSLAANNCHLWTFFYSSHPMLLRFNRKSEIYNKHGGRKRPGPTPRNDVWGGQHRWKLSSRPVAIERDRGITDGMLSLKIHWGGIYDRKNLRDALCSARYEFGRRC